MGNPTLIGRPDLFPGSKLAMSQTPQDKVWT